MLLSKKILKLKLRPRNKFLPTKILINYSIKAIKCYILLRLRLIAGLAIKINKLLKKFQIKKSKA